jgi:GT2 family glycosyltransferase
VLRHGQTLCEGLAADRFRATDNLRVVAGVFEESGGAVHRGPAAARPPRSWIVPPVAAPAEQGAPPRFSVVIPAYQAAATIGRAVASALEQTWAPQEVIVVDDGSTDELDDALAPFLDRITLLRKTNGGGASALNRGLASAVGDFFAILDADDSYGPRRLEAIAELAVSRPDVDIITTDSELVLHEQVVGRFHDGTPFVGEHQRTAIFWSCFVGGWPAVRVAALRAVGGFDETVPIAYDWDCWLRLILHGATAGFVNEPHLAYRLRADSLSASRVAALHDRVRILEKALANPDLQPDERPALTRALRHHRMRAVLAEAGVKTADGTAGRAWFARRAVSGGLPLAVRLRLALAAASPRHARKLLPSDPGALDRRLAGSADDAG